MGNATEQLWKELQGQVVHVRIGNIFPSGDDLIQVNAEILEHEHCFSFEVDTEEKNY